LLLMMMLTLLYEVCGSWSDRPRTIFFFFVGKEVKREAREDDVGEGGLGAKGDDDEKDVTGATFILAVCVTKAGETEDEADDAEDEEEDEEEDNGREENEIGTSTGTESEATSE